MRIRNKRMWMMVGVLALSAEGSAVAQSAPAHACRANEVTLACMTQWSAPMGPELTAARASLAGGTKNGDTHGAADLYGLASRQATSSGPAASGLTMPHSAGAAIQSTVSGEGLQVLQGDGNDVTSKTAGSTARVVPVQDGPASTSVRAPHAETVIRGQINPAAKSCYENDPDSKARRPGRLIILIDLIPSGDVDSVSVLTSAGLSPSVASCITTVATAARFAPPGGNGATIRAAFTFPTQEEDADPPALGAPAKARAHVAHNALAKAGAQQPANGTAAKP